MDGKSILMSKNKDTELLFGEYELECLIEEALMNEADESINFDENVIYKMIMEKQKKF